MVNHTSVKQETHSVIKWLIVSIVFVLIFGGLHKAAEVSIENDRIEHAVWDVDAILQTVRAHYRNQPVFSSGDLTDSVSNYGRFAENIWLTDDAPKSGVALAANQGWGGAPCSSLKAPDVLEIILWSLPNRVCNKLLMEFSDRTAHRDVVCAQANDVKGAVPTAAHPNPIRLCNLVLYFKK